jgi:hypothetical protein
MILLVDKNPNEMAADATTADMIIKTDSVMAMMCIDNNIKLFSTPCFLVQYHAPPSETTKSVMKPANSPTKIPTIRILFVVCLLPELYISIET